MTELYIDGVCVTLPAGFTVTVMTAPASACVFPTPMRSLRAVTTVPVIRRSPISFSVPR